MQVSATEAKNRLGHLLEQCQRGPVTIEKSGRRHSVLLSAAHYDALLINARTTAQAVDPGQAFYDEHRNWVDAENQRVERQGLWNDGLRVW